MPWTTRCRALPGASTATAKACAGGTEAASSASSNTTVSADPDTVADESAGPAVSTLWAASWSRPSWASAASAPAAERIVAPLSSSVFPRTATPPGETSPAAAA